MFSFGVPLGRVVLGKQEKILGKVISKLSSITYLDLIKLKYFKASSFKGMSSRQKVLTSHQGSVFQSLCP